MEDIFPFDLFSSLPVKERKLVEELMTSVDIELGNATKEQEEDGERIVDGVRVKFMRWTPQIIGNITDLSTLKGLYDSFIPWKNKFISIRELSHCETIFSLIEDRIYKLMFDPQTIKQSLKDIFL